MCQLVQLFDCCYTFTELSYNIANIVQTKSTQNLQAKTDLSITHKNKQTKNLVW